MLVSRLATANQRLYEQAVKDGAPDMGTLASAVDFYDKARTFWSHFGHDNRVRMNVAVAEANYLNLLHLKDKDADLGRDYIVDFSASGRFAVFLPDSIYRAVVLQNESVYFFDKHDYASAINAKLESWRILAARNKARN